MYILIDNEKYNIEIIRKNIDGYAVIESNIPKDLGLVLINNNLKYEICDDSTNTAIYTNVEFLDSDLKKITYT